MSVAAPHRPAAAPSAATPPVHPETGERLFTAADLAVLPGELPSGPVRYELNDGRLVVMAPPGFQHGRFEIRLAAALLYQGEHRGHGVAASGEAALLLRRGPDRVVGADAAFVANRSLPVRRSPEGYLETIPDLVVEVLSKNDRPGEVAAKVADYLAAGVRLVWVADPADRTLTAHRPGAAPVVLGEADALTCEDIIPGFRLPVADVFRD
jgi:Uma2 family endonuclease